MLHRRQSRIQWTRRGQADNRQSLKETQGSNLEGTPQIHFRNQGFPPVKHSSPVLRRTEGGEGERGGGRGREGEGGRGTLPTPLSQGPTFKEPHVRPEGIPALHTCPAHIPHRKGPDDHLEKKRPLCQSYKKKKKKAHKSNPITVKFQGDPIFFWYQNLDTLHISLKKKKKIGSWGLELCYTRGLGIWGVLFLWWSDVGFTEILQAVAKIVF